MPAQLALGLLTFALGGTFAPALLPFDEPRALNYMLILLAAALLAIARLLRRPRARAARCGGAGWLLLSFHLYVLLITIKQAGEEGIIIKAVVFCCVCGCAWQVARLLEPDELLATLFWSLCLVVGASTALAIARPDIAVMPFVRGDAWTGLYGQKNAFGRQAALLGLVSLFMLLRHGGGRLLPHLALIVAVVGLLASLSRTSQVLFLAGGCAVLILNVLRRQAWGVLLVGLLGGLALLEARLIWAPAVFGISPEGMVVADYLVDLTGRLPIWQFGWWLFMQQPVWGAGFDAIWNYGGGSAIYHALGWRVTDSHNGYLDVLVQSGLVGAALYGGALVLASARALRITLSGQPKTVEQALIAVFLPLHWLINITSSQVMEILSLWNFLCLVLCFASDWHRHAHRQESHAHATVQHRDPLPQPARPVVARHSVGRVPELSRS
ncbi:O-antigen ligase family protein [Rhodoligotrophos defluvii]|uniref:O-antigen ligase family protein n=1 Tax=Rhodoligotrophos defluvii TaxID=2561934 RepID=UPI001484DBAA|nr:O-antigen ligase family protein [Rhodoligotrophos defluvii]